MKTESRKLPYAVRNWKDFQHYKHRTPPWIKLHRKLLDDLDYHKCDPLAAKCLPLIWLIASEHDGMLPDLPELSFRLRITETQCAKVISALSSWLYQDASNVLADCKQDATLETETETEKKTEKKKGVAPCFSSESFVMAWQDWIQYRREMKKPLTETGERGQMKTFQEWGEKRSVAAIRHTIFMGWQGIREPDLLDTKPNQKQQNNSGNGYTVTA